LLNKVVVIYFYLFPFFHWFDAFLNGISIHPMKLYFKFLNWISRINDFIWCFFKWHFNSSIEIIFLVINDFIWCIFKWHFNSSIEIIFLVFEFVVLIFNHSNEVTTEEVLCCSWVGWPKVQATAVEIFEKKKKWLDCLHTQCKRKWNRSITLLFPSCSFFLVKYLLMQ